MSPDVFPWDWTEPSQPAEPTEDEIFSEWLTFNALDCTLDEFREAYLSVHRARRSAT